MAVRGDVDVGPRQELLGSLSKQEHSQVCRGGAGVGGRRELVRDECSRPLLGSGPIGKPVAEVALQPQIVQIVERAAEDRSFFDGVGHSAAAQHPRILTRTDAAGQQARAVTSRDRAGTVGRWRVQSSPDQRDGSGTAGCLYSAGRIQ